MDGKQAAIVVRLERVDLHPGSTDGDVVPDSIIIGNLRRINTRQDKQICEHCETIGGLRATISELEERDALKTTAIDELQHLLVDRDKHIKRLGSVCDNKDESFGKLLRRIDEQAAKLNIKSADSDALAQVIDVVNDGKIHCSTAMNRIEDIVESHSPENPNDIIEALEAELSARKDDSMVLMQVVEALREWQGDPFNPRHMIERMRHIVEDYIDVPEIPDRHETSVITDQVIDDALDVIVSNMFNETAGAMQTAIAHQDIRIKYLDAQIDKKSVFISSLLRNDKRFHTLLDDRDKIIESLRVDVADRDKHIDELENRVGVLPENFWVVVGQLRDANRQQTTAINGLEETLKLERIDHTAEVSAITNTLHDTIKALRTDVSDRDRRIEESGAVIAKLRIERNRLTHNLHVREGKP